MNSQPESASVHLHRENQPPLLLGRTPVSLDEGALELIDSGAARITIEKEGYHRESVLIPSSALGMKRSVSLVLKEDVVSKSCEQQNDSLERVARGIASAQILLVQKRLDESEMLLQRLIGEFPFVSVFHDLLGNIHYLRKDPERALAEYRRSNEIRPGNPDTLRMIRKMEELRSPASGNSRGSEAGGSP